MHRVWPVHRWSIDSPRETSPVSLGEEIGRGLRSVVYAYGARDAVKVPNVDVPLSWVVEEHRLTEVVAGRGVTVPGRRRLVEIEGRTALVSERILGPSMWQRLLAEPDAASDLGTELARVQREVGSHPVSFELPSQRDRIVSKIHIAARTYGAHLVNALDVLPADDGPLVICHGDLHPRNLLVSDRSTVLVDWFDASRGRIEGEIARTVLVLEDSHEIETRAGIGIGPVWDDFARSYVTTACDEAGLDPAELEPWLLAQRVARLAEGFGERRLDELGRRLRVT